MTVVWKVLVTSNLQLSDKCSEENSIIGEKKYKVAKNENTQVKYNNLEFVFKYSTAVQKYLKSIQSAVSAHQTTLC